MFEAREYFNRLKIVDKVEIRRVGLIDYLRLVEIVRSIEECGKDEDKIPFMREFLRIATNAENPNKALTTKLFEEAYRFNIPEIKERPAKITAEKQDVYESVLTATVRISEKLSVPADEVLAGWNIFMVEIVQERLERIEAERKAELVRIVSGGQTSAADALYDEFVYRSKGKRYERVSLQSLIDTYS